MTRGSSWLSYNLILDGFHGVSLLVFEAFSKPLSSSQGNSHEFSWPSLSLHSSRYPSTSPFPHSTSPCFLPSFSHFHSRTKIQIQCATKDNKEATPPRQASIDGGASIHKKGVALYKPKSYDVLVTDAAKSLAYAIQDGKTRLEIDFPPLPSNILHIRDLQMSSLMPTFNLPWPLSGNSTENGNPGLHSVS
ncbi:hypothetical protein ES319_D05G122300v1 [Gossypium barbadense]|uniref:DUF1995 domain-containing protein n=1 Tax=Gossypium barbadense TaxID=3634 RepID=A0A5J5RC45_GOSBA|nr:hypothetical protein ES319_D05G122300v1 [Gossypium barbadense]